jgi:hypothetical protein
MSLFGMEERIQKARTALVNGLMTRAAKVLEPYNDKPVAEIPKHELARAMVLEDIADVIKSLAG